MFERLPRSLAAFGLTALLALPSMAAAHPRHATARSHSTTHSAASHSAHTSASGRSRRGSRGHHVERAAFVRHEAPPAMDPTRATAIQAALIRAGYLTGEPTGVWDASSVAAMQKLQDDNGWQTKYTPDSRALVKLGLGGASLPPSQPTSAAPSNALAEAPQTPASIQP